MTLPGRDIRAGLEFQAAEAFYADLLEPGTGFVYDGADLDISPDGTVAVFTARTQPDLHSPPHSHVAAVDLATGHMEAMTAGPRHRTPRYSPGGTLAYLHDPDGSGRFELVLPDGPDIAIDGSVEYYAWSPDGSRILLGAAGLGADLSGAQGGTTIAKEETDLPNWIPTVETDDAEDLWRRAWVVDAQSGDCRVVSAPGLNVWEATWLGNDRIAAVVSDHHGEGAWYTARLIAIDVATGSTAPLYRPTEQVGWPAGTPDGRVAFVEAICSDRWIVAGDLKVRQTDGAIVALDTAGVDVTWLRWVDETRLAYAGVRGLETVVGWVSPDSRELTEVWASDHRTFGEWYPQAALASDRFHVVGEAYEVAPELAVIDGSGYEVVRSFAPAALSEPDFVRGVVEPVRWQAPDGLEIEGRLVRAEPTGSHPVVMNIHGGPIWAHRNRWMGRQRGAELLARSGISVFYPNPRGSSGRGQEFAGMVRGDMGGADTYDYLSGLDALVERGITDPDRIGVTGISYGGFMSAWLITQDARFAAAVVISPVSDWYSQHRTSQIPFFDELFLEPGASAPGGLFFERSPAFFAESVTCPTLVLTGDLDKNTPPGQAVEFYRSLIEHGATAALIRYPDAGHGARQFPENIDVSARTMHWFGQHL